MKSNLYILFFIIILLSCQNREGNVEDGSILSSDTISDDTLSRINKKWAGNWDREGSIDPATLIIEDVSTSSFTFHVSSHDGMKSGELSGEATLEGNMALFLSVHDLDTCQLIFILQDSIVQLNQASNKCAAASGINFSGEYFEERYFEEKVMEEDAENRGSN